MMGSRWVGVVGSWVTALTLASQMALAYTSTVASPEVKLESRGVQHTPTAQLLGMPLQFEINQGQVDPEVQFLARGKGYTLFLTPTESVMVLQQRGGTSTDGNSVGP